jgi:hypothetical protein
MLNLRVQGEQRTIFDPQAMQAIRLDGKWSLPHSYQSFMQTYGFGRLLGLLIIYVPLENHPYSLLGHGTRVRDTMREAVAEGNMEFERDGSRALALRLFPFAESENGEYFCWDLDESQDAAMRSEHTIYCVGARLQRLNRAADSLDALVDALCSTGIKRVMGTGYEPLAADFQALPLHC